MFPGPPSGEQGHVHVEEHCPAKAGAGAPAPRYLRQTRTGSVSDLHRADEGVVVATVPRVAGRPTPVMQLNFSCIIL